MGLGDRGTCHIGGGGVEGDLQQVLHRQRITVILHGDIQMDAVDGHAGGGGRGGQPLRDGHIDLCHCKAVGHSLVLVDHQVDGRIAFGEAGVDLFIAGDGFHDFDYFTGDLLQYLQIVAVDLQGKTAAEHGGHIVHATGIGGDGAGHIRRCFIDLLCDGLDPGCGSVRRQHHIVHIAAVGSAAAAHAAKQAHGGAAVHGTHFLDLLDLQEHIHHIIGHGVGLFPCQTFRCGDIDRDLVAGHFRQDHDAHIQHDDHADGKQDDGCGQGSGLVPQAPIQHLAIAVLEFIKPGMRLLLCILQHGGGGCGHDGQRYQQGGCQTVADAKAQRKQQLPDHAGGKHHRQEHANCGQSGGNDGAGHLLGTLDSGSGSADATGPETINILDDNDGVVHQHADAKGEAAEGHHIQGNIGKVHQHQGEKHGKRDADGDDQRRLYILEEQRKDDDRQDRTHDDAGKNRINDQIDIAALVHEGGQVGAFILAFQLGKGFLAVFRGLICTGGAAFENAEDDSLLAVEAGVAEACVVDDGDGGYIGNAHLTDAVHAHQQRAGDVLHAGVFIAYLQKPAVVIGIVDITGRHGEVLGVDQLGKHAHREQLVQIRAGQGIFSGFFVLGSGSGQLRLRGSQLRSGGGKAYGGLQLTLGHAGDGILQTCQDLGNRVQNTGKLAEGSFHLRQSFLQISKLIFRQGGLHVPQQLQQVVDSGAQLGSDGNDVLNLQILTVQKSGKLFQSFNDGVKGLAQLTVFHGGTQLTHLLQQIIHLHLHFRGCGFDAAVQLVEDRAGHGGAEACLCFGEGLLAFCHLGFRFVQLFAGGCQLLADGLQDPVIQCGDLGTIQLYMDALFHKTHRRYAGDTALTLNIGLHRIGDEGGKLVDIVSVTADGYIHGGHHVHADLDDGGRAAHFRQGCAQLIEGLRDFDHGGVHIRAVFKFQLH